jgi:methionine sulfoxide reductase heme-binding subunit
MRMAAGIQTHAARGARPGLAGWPLVGWSAMGLAGMVAIILALYGTGEAGTRAIIRGSAFTSVLLFTAAFVASAVHRIWPTLPTRWLLANRRYLGVSFAVSHFIHLLAIIRLTRLLPDFQVSPATVIGGTVGYVFIAAMVATSFDRTAAWIGARRWQLLHRTGVYVIWAIFAFTYVPRATQSAAYLPVVLVLFAALGVRLAARVRQRRRRAV